MPPPLMLPAIKLIFTSGSSHGLRATSTSAEAFTIK